MKERFYYANPLKSVLECLPEKGFPQIAQILAENALGLMNGSTIKTYQHSMVLAMSRRLTSAKIWEIRLRETLRRTGLPETTPRSAYARRFGGQVCGK